MENIGKLSELGVDIFVAGSAIFESKDYQKTILNRLTYLNDYLTQIYPDNRNKKINYLDLRYSNQIVVNYQ